MSETVLRDAADISAIVAAAQAHRRKAAKAAQRCFEGAASAPQALEAGVGQLARKCTQREVPDATCRLSML